MSGRQINTVEVQFTDGTYFRVDTYYAISAREFARKLGDQCNLLYRHDTIPTVKGVGLFKNHDNLIATFGDFNEELSK